jgi:protein gp37
LNKTKIEWCDSTINPVVGCTYGCDFCYARRMNNRFHYIEDFAKPQFFPERLEQLKSKKPKNIFMDSMSDIADWDDKWVADTIDAMQANPQHNYLFLSKRPELIYGEWYQFDSPNIWCGITATDDKTMREAVEYFDSIWTNNNFLSIEPLLGKIDIDYSLKVVDWVILGAETGNRKGKVIPWFTWIEHIVEKCKRYNIPVFMKDSLIPLIGEESMLREFPEGLRHENKQHK